MPDASFPGAGSADDWDQDAEMAAYLADIEAGRAEEPGPWDSPACMVSLGEACDVDPAVLGAGGAAFAEGRAGDAMVPGPVLAALTGQAAEEMAGLSDDALLGAVSAAWAPDRLRVARWMISARYRSSRPAPSPAKVPGSRVARSVANASFS